MKKIINGKMYNTETAKEIASYWNGLNYGDFRYCSEILYQKKTGEFFLYGDGGPMTEYRVECGDGWRGGETIIPLTDTVAREWLEGFSDADTYIRVFGKPEE